MISARQTADATASGRNARVVWRRSLWSTAKAAATYFVVLVVLSLALFPVYWMIVTAFKPRDDIIADPPVWLFEPSLHSFRELFVEMGALQGLINSLVVVSLSTCLALIFGTMAAYALARYSIKGKNVLAFEILTIRMLPPIVSVIPLFILSQKLGLFDTYWILIAIYTLMGLPFVVWVMRVFIQEIPKSIEEAALIDGCTRMQVLIHIALPLMLPGLAATVVIVFMFAWNEYLFASLLTSSDVRTLPVVAAGTLKPKGISWGTASAAGVLMSVPVVVLALLMQRYLVRGLTFGAVKT